MYYWVSPSEIRVRTVQGEKLAYRKDGMPFRLIAAEHGDTGQIPIHNWDDGQTWSDGSVEFRRGVLVAHKFAA